jgi:hypothetical protein
MQALRLYEGLFSMFNFSCKSKKKNAMLVETQCLRLTDAKTHLQNLWVYSIKDFLWMWEEAPQYFGLFLLENGRGLFFNALIIK